MARLYAMHKIALKPKADPEEFERFATEEARPVFEQIPGMRWRLLKGDRGDRKGRYLEILEFDSVESRDAFIPEDGGELSAKYQTYMERWKPVMERWVEFAASEYDPTFTDYVVVGE